MTATITHQKTTETHRTDPPTPSRQPNKGTLAAVAVAISAAATVVLVGYVTSGPPQQSPADADRSSEIAEHGRMTGLTASNTNDDSFQRNEIHRFDRVVRMGDDESFARSEASRFERLAPIGSEGDSFIRNEASRFDRQRVNGD